MIRATRILTRGFVLIVAMSLWGVEAMAVDGLVTIRSDRGPAETMNRLEAAVKERGLTVFGRIDHAAGAKEVGLPLRPTSVLIFGNAKGGTPLVCQAWTLDWRCKSSAEQVGSNRKPKATARRWGRRETIRPGAVRPCGEEPGGALHRT